MRDPQTVPAATFDHFDFFFPWVGCSVFFSSLVRSSVLVFIFLFFILASVSLGTEKKKKSVLADRCGPINSVKNIEWWQVSDGAKQVGHFKWWVMSDKWWKKIQTRPYVQYLGVVPEVPFLRFCHVDFFSLDESVFFS